MQTVSAGWITNQEQVMTSKAYLELTFHLSGTENTLYNRGTITDNGHITMSDVDNLKEYTVYDIAKYATLEANMWALDGTFDIVPTSAPYGYEGYVGDEIGDASGEFTTNPLITWDLAATILSALPGVTLTWGSAYGEYATDFVVTTYVGAVQKEQIVVSGNTDLITVVLLSSTDSFSKITVEVTKWNTPYHRTRMDKLYRGIRPVYTNNEIKNYATKHRADPYSFMLPSGELSFSLDNSLGQFDPTDTDSFFQYLNGNEKIDVRVGYKINNIIEWINNGKYYLTAWNNLTSTDRADFVAQDLLTGWKETYLYATVNWGATDTLMDLALGILDDMGLSSSDYSLSSTLDNYIVSNLVLLPLASHPVCLQLIANSAGCCLFMDKDGILTIRESPAYGSPITLNDFSITRDVQFENSGLVYTPLKDTVFVQRFDAIRDTGIAHADMLVANLELTASAATLYTLYHDQPGMSGSMTATVTSGIATIVNSYHYSYVSILEISGTMGDVIEITIDGVLLTVTPRGGAAPNSTKNASNIVYIENTINCTDAQQVRAELVGQHLVDETTRLKYTPNFRLDPRLDIADYISIENPNGTDTIFLNELNVSFNGTFKAIGEGRTI